LKPRAVYLFLLSVQLTGVLFIILDGLPEFRHLVAHPGEQLPYTRYESCCTRDGYRDAGRVLVSPATNFNSLSRFEYDLEPPVFVSGAPYLYFWWLAVRRRFFPAPSGNQSRCRCLADVETWTAARGVSVRIILRNARAGTTWARAWKRRQHEWVGGWSLTCALRDRAVSALCRHPTLSPLRILDWA